MNKRQVIILWIIAAVLAVAVTAVKLGSKDASQSATRRAAGQTLFENFPAADVATVEIQGAAGKVTLARKDGKWTITERDAFPGNAGYVNDFLRTLAELKVTRGMEAGPSFAPRFGMDESAGKAEDRGLTAIFKDAASKEIARVSLGKNIESAADAGPFGGAASVGRYIRNHADESGFYAVSEMFPSISDDATRWLATDFISPEKIRSVQVSKKGGGEVAWKVTRDDENAEFKLEGATGDETLNTTNATPLKTALAYARFTDVIPADQLAARTGDAAEKRSVVIETFEGFTYTITIVPAKPAPAKEGETPATTDDQLLTVEVAAELPKERMKEEGEKPEDAKTKDEAFTQRLKTLTEKLDKEKAFAGRTFLVSKTTVDALLKERTDMVTKAQPPAPEAANQGSVQQLPGGIVATPPAQPGAKPVVEAVTPPISVPPADQPARKTQDQNKPKGN
jgi:hypothetical protein